MKKNHNIDRDKWLIKIKKEGSTITKQKGAY